MHLFFFSIKHIKKFELFLVESFLKILKKSCILDQSQVSNSKGLKVRALQRETYFIKIHFILRDCKTEIDNILFNLIGEKLLHSLPRYPPYLLTDSFIRSFFHNLFIPKRKGEKLGPLS